MPKKLLVFAPHPDDAEFFAGGTIARLIQQGWQATIVTVTDGRCGSYHHDSQALVELRAAEARRASAALGAQPPIFLGHPDQGLDRLPPGYLREQFIRLIRQIRPEAVIAEDTAQSAATQEIHPDHRAVAWAASDAVNFSMLPLVHPEHLEDGLEPHFVSEKYYYAGGPEAQNKIIDITATLPIKLAALEEHRSQVEFLVEDVLLQMKMAGFDLTKRIGPALSDPLVAFKWAMEAEAAAVGARIGVSYAEAFRYVRFSPLIETLLAAASPTPS